MAYGDHDLLDAFKTFHGDSSMDDDTMQVLADDWFVRKATPYERRSTLLTLKKTLEEEDTSSSNLRQRAPLLQMYRRLSTYEQNLRRLGK
jgi:hypothetical protein